MKNRDHISYRVVTALICGYGLYVCEDAPNSTREVTTYTLRTRGTVVQSEHCTVLHCFDKLAQRHGIAAIERTKSNSERRTIESSAKKRKSSF